MNGKMHMISPNGSELVTPLDHAPSLEELRAQLGGRRCYIERVPLFDKYRGERCTAFCDEEGKLKGLPSNLTATKAWHECFGKDTGDTLVGNVIVLTGDDELFEAL